ncbi:Protein-lysine N-methyltransferase EFM2 [Cyphellophora attinorum]|uniref:Protein-lysine N-methyltransferase EFM2 n=1 Tax=Cyphellophora attinorum TaxID=1664694 RepID=A0A0N0NPI0_9EURO|nr:Protein-lysine N-methyltransferase EFM2 [Phialophora attinorum]KPI42748.1 Protein-lysine N-methyltransferase EFM2 [Phialophora attinorum]
MARSVDNKAGDVRHWPSAEDSLHVLDLPQLWQKPSADEMMEVLRDLRQAPDGFQDSGEVAAQEGSIQEAGIPAYLTSIIASKLVWIDDEDARESIWELASLRLSERSGRTAMPAMTRTFDIAEGLAIQLHEPSLVGDNLGLKTWASSLLLSKQLQRLSKYLPDTTSVLELGAGTGLVGVSAACLWHTSVVLTDLPEIVPNLEHNLGLNRETISSWRGNATAMPLDWSDLSSAPTKDEEKYMIVIAADPIYSPDHPPMLVDTIARWLKETGDARVVIELPRRFHYTGERAHLEDLMRQAKFEIVVQGVESGYDDWKDESGHQAVVECEYSIWRRNDKC